MKPPSTILKTILITNGTISPPNIPSAIKIRPVTRYFRSTFFLIGSVLRSSFKISIRSARFKNLPVIPMIITDTVNTNTAEPMKPDQDNPNPSPSTLWIRYSYNLPKPNAIIPPARVLTADNFPMSRSISFIIVLESIPFAVPSAMRIPASRLLKRRNSPVA